MSWRERAACRDASPDVFFPPEYDGHEGASRQAKHAEELRVATAKSYCAICPVRETCLNDALERGEKVGIWGGVDLDAPRRLDDMRTRAKYRRRERQRKDADARRVAAEAEVTQIADYWRRRALGIAVSDTEREEA